MTLATLLAALTLAGPVAEPLLTPDSPLCSVRQLQQNPDGYHWPVADIERFVDEADVIVRAVAVGVESDTEPVPYASTVRFRTVQVLSGGTEGGDLVFSGTIVEQPDFNEGSVPYQMVRPSGQRGDCFAREYRIDGEYLFLLRDDEGTLTPYWAPLAPTNEEIRGEEDPWVAWVRDRIEEPAPARAQESPERWRVLTAVVAEVRSSGLPTETLAVDSDLYDASEKIGRWWKVVAIPDAVLRELGVIGIDDFESVVSCPGLPSSCELREGITTALRISVPDVANGRASVVVRATYRTESSRTPVAAQIFELLLVERDGTWCVDDKVTISFT